MTRNAAEIVRNGQTLSGLAPEFVLAAETAAEYRRQRRLLLDSLVLLHNNASVLRRIASYPKRFLGPARTFLSLLQFNVWENSLVIAHRLWNEEYPTSVSLRTVAKLARGGEPSHRADMDARLKKAKPKGDAKAALQRLKRYRNVRLGHLDKRIDIDHPDAHLPMTLEKFERVVESLTGYYNATGIDEETFFELSDLGAGGGGRSGVERTLDGIAIQSPWVTRYAEDPEWWWGDYRPKLTEEEFQLLMELRARMGLPPMESP